MSERGLSSRREWRIVYFLRKQEQPFEWRSWAFLCTLLGGIGGSVGGERPLKTK